MTAEYVTTTAALPTVNTEVAFGGIVNQHNYIDAYVDFLANVGQRVQLRLYSTAGPLGVRSLVAQSPWLLAGSEPTRALQAIKYVSGNLYELFAIADGVCTNIKCSLVGYEAQENYIPEDESTGDVALVFGTNVTFATITNPHSYFDASVKFNTFLNKEVLWSLYATAGAGGVRARVAQSKSPRATINNQQLVVLESIGPIGASQMELVGNCLEPFTGSGIVRGSLVGFDPIVDILNVAQQAASFNAESVGRNLNQSLIAYDVTAANNDGVTLVQGNIVLLIGQTSLPENGPWVVGQVTANTAPLTRPSWFKTGATLPYQTRVNINGNGNTWAYKTFVVAGIVGGVIGTDTIICAPNIMTGKVNLVAGTANVTLPALTLGSGGANSIPTAIDQTSAAAVKAVITGGGGTLTLTGTGTDTIAWTVQNF